MNCKNHSERLAVGYCSRCGSPICAECCVSIDGRDVCKACVNSHTHSFPTAPPPPMPAPRVHHKHPTGFSGFWSFLFSFVPGAGHMYMGFMKKGLFYMSAALAIIFVLSVCDYRLQVFFALSLGVLWCVQFFDVISIKRRLRAGIAVDDNINEFLNFVTVHKAKILIGLVVMALFSLVGYFSDMLNRFSYGGYRAFSPFVVIMIVILVVILCTKKRK